MTAQQWEKPRKAAQLMERGLDNMFGTQLQGDNNQTKLERKTSANLGFEEKLWQAADKLRGHMDPAGYKHVLLGLIFLKHISDDFFETYRRLRSKRSDKEEDQKEYQEKGVFWVPAKARWPHIQSQVHKPDIGKIVDEAMQAIEDGNAKLKDALPKEYGKLFRDRRRLGELIELVTTIGVGGAENRSKDTLGRVYEYLLGKFASAEGNRGGEFYTPPSVVKLLVQMVEPYTGRVYDPCCGSGGMFVQSEKFVLSHGGRKEDILIFGQESNPTTWRLCKMNLAIRAMEGDIGRQNADTFHADLHLSLEADYVIANPPFNMKDWGAESLQRDNRWRYGRPPNGNANFAWLQHMIHHLSPNGIAGVVLSNGSLSANQTREEGEIRNALIEADLVDCIVALPSQLFYNTQIAACLWLIARNKRDSRFRCRVGQTLFIYAASFGRMVDRIHRELTDQEINQISAAYESWRSRKPDTPYRDIPGFCRSASVDEVRSHRLALVPGRYVGFDRDLLAEKADQSFVGELACAEERLKKVVKTSESVLKILRNLPDG